MGLMDKLKGMTKGRERQISSAVDKAGDLVDKKTKGKYSGHIQKAEDGVDKALGVPADRASVDQALGVAADRAPVDKALDVPTDGAAGTRPDPAAPRPDDPGTARPPA